MKSGSCSAASCPSGYSTSVSCSNGTKEESSSYYSGGSVCKRCVNCGSGEQCACPAGQMADGSGGCKAGCAYTSNAACVSSTSDCTSCTKDGDGCYSCSSCANGYELKNGSCSATACPSGYSTSVSCSNGTKAADSSYYSGISVCKYCTNCGAGETCACSNGKVADGNGNCKCPDGKVDNGSGGCKNADPCANVTCDGGKVCSNGTCVCPSNKPYSAGGQCRECTSDSHCGNTQSCSNYQCVDLSCSSCETASNHQCVPNACPDGWNSPKNLPFCLIGQTKKTDSCGCWKCEGEACPAGYTRGTPLNCLTSQKVATIGKKVNGQYCSKCVDKDCYDYGYLPQTDGCPKDEKMMAVTIPEASYLSCGKCSEINTFIPIGGGDVSTKCPSSQLDCGSIGCCPNHINGCAAYANDCKYVGNGLYTPCRCMVYDTTSKFTN